MGRDNGGGGAGSGKPKQRPGFEGRKSSFLNA
jgi:hypothetical protein